MRSRVEWLLSVDIPAWAGWPQGTIYGTPILAGDPARFADYQAELRLVAADQPDFALLSVGTGTRQHPTSRWTLCRCCDGTCAILHLRFLTTPTVSTISWCASASAVPQHRPCPSLTPLFVTDGRGTRLGNEAIIPQMLHVAGVEGKE